MEVSFLIGGGRAPSFCPSFPPPGISLSSLLVPLLLNHPSWSIPGTKRVEVARTHEVATRAIIAIIPELVLGGDLLLLDFLV